MQEMELTFREELYPHWIIYVLLSMIALLAVLKYRKELVFIQLQSTFFRTPSAAPNTKENFSILGGTNWVLVFNYLVVLSITAYMLLIYFDQSNYWMVLIPTALYFVQLSSLAFVSMLSGEFKKIRENIFLLNYTTHITGILLIPFLFIWILNPHLSSYMAEGVIYLFISLHFIRLLRGVFLAIRNKVLWYYIILYLCGLEIWPVLAAYLFVSPNSIG